jgi:hypothetical protein
MTELHDDEGDFTESPIETDADFCAADEQPDPDETEYDVTPKQTRTKQLIAAVGVVLVIVASAIVTGEFDMAEIVQAVIGLLTVLGVGEVPNTTKR